MKHVRTRVALLLLLMLQTETPVTAGPKTLQDEKSPTLPPGLQDTPVPGGFSLPLAPGLFPTRIVQSGTIIISWSEAHDELQGFSNSIGNWAVLKIPRQDRIIPVVGGYVGAVRVGDSMAAYSGRTGTWDTVLLSPDSKALPIVDNEVVQCYDGGHHYTFAAAKGAWTSPSDPEFQPGEFTWEMQHARPQELWSRFELWLKERCLPKLNATRSNSRITVGAPRQSWLREAREQLEKLDVANPEVLLPPTVAVGSNANAGLVPARVRNQAMIAPSLSGVSAAEAEVDARCKALAERLRNMGDTTNDVLAAPVQAQLTAELRDSVAEAFVLRQQRQDQELQRLRMKLNALEQAMKSREASRDQIIRRRVEELLDPNVVWAVGDQRTTTTASSAAAVTGAPIGLPGAPVLASPALAPTPVTGQRTATTRPEDTAAPLATPPDPDDIMTQLVRDRAQVAECQRTIASLQQELEKLGRNHPTARRILTQLSHAIGELKRCYGSWKYSWTRYQSARRVLQLDLEEARVALEPLALDFERKQKLAERGAVTQQEVKDAESKFRIAQIQLEKAGERLSLYDQLATDSPSLNPETFDLQMAIEGTASASADEPSEK